MSQMRFVEPRLGAVALGHACIGAGRGLIAACAIGIATVLALGVVGTFGDDVADGFARSGVFGVGLTLIAGIVVMTTGVVIDRTNRIRIVEAALAVPDTVPPSGSLEIIGWSGPRRSIGMALYAIAVLLGFAAVTAFVMQESFSLHLLLAALGFGFIARMCMWRLPAAQQREMERLVPLDAELRRRRQSAEAHDAEARRQLPEVVAPRNLGWWLAGAALQLVPRLLIAAAAALAVSIGSAVVAESSSNDVVISGAHVGAVIGLTVLVGSLLVTILAEAVAMIATAFGARRTLRWATATPSRVKVTALAPALLGDRAATIGARWFALLGGLLLEVAAIAISVRDRIAANTSPLEPIVTLDPSLLLLLALGCIAVGVVWVLTDGPRARHERNAIREAMRPGDVLALVQRLPRRRRRAAPASMVWHRKNTPPEVSEPPVTPEL